MKALLIIPALAALSGSAFAVPIPLSSGNLVYSQNFDSLPSEANNGVATPAWSDDSTLSGWWFYTAGNGGTPPGLAGATFPWYASNGSAAPNAAPQGHGFYSLGVSPGTDRALGSAPTTPLGELSAIVIFQNTTADPLQLSRVKFTGEAYRTISVANNRDGIFMWWKAAASESALTTNTTALVTSNTTVFVSGTVAASTTTGPTSSYIAGWTHLPEFNYIYSNAAASTWVNPPETRAFDSAPALPVIVHAGEYLAIRWSNINDNGTEGMVGIDDLELTFDVSTPPVVPAVTAVNSPQITFTPAANTTQFYIPPPNDQSELGWSGGTVASNVQTQPSNGAFIGTAKYFRINGNPTLFSTDAVDVSAIAGQTLKGHIELSFYSTSSSGLDALDVLNARLEVAVDGNFNNTAAGNILTENFVDLPANSTAAQATAVSSAIPAANPYINLTATTYPTADFIFYPMEKTIPIPAGATAGRARILFTSGTGISNTEHILLDNVRFSLGVAELDTDLDNIPDAYEDANGLDKNSNADRDTDLDGDGQSNYLEFVAGTGASDPASTLRITSAGLSATGEVSLSWASVPGKRYRARVSTDLGNTNAWTNLGNPVTATGTTSSIPGGNIIPPGLFPRYFLRIEVVP